MRWVNRIQSVIANLFSTKRAEQQIDEELQAHLGLLVEEKMRQGLSEAEAMRRSRLELGGIEQVKQAIREGRHGASLESVLQDIRIGARVLLQQRGFSFVAVLTVGIGIGSMTAIHSFSQFLFNQSVAGASRSEELATVFVNYKNTRSTRPSNAYPHYLELKERQSTFTDLAHYFRFETVFATDEVADQVTVETVSGNYFRVLGVMPALGRVLEMEDDREDAEVVAVVSYALWRRSLGGRSDILGQRISLNGIPTRIVGVAPRDFVGIDLDNFTAPAFWVTLHFPFQAPSLRSIPVGQLLTSTAGGASVGRLRPGVDARIAAANLNGLAGNLSVVGNRRIDSITVIPVSQARIAPGEQARTGPRLNIFFAVSGIVLLGACFNVANFLITRSTARRREFAIRLSLGATRLRVIQQLFIEALLLSIVSGVAGVLLASALLRAFGTTVSRFLGIPLTMEVSLDPTAYSIAAILVVASALVFGIIPTVLASLRNPVDDLRNPKPTWTWVGFRISFRQVLLTLQVALAVMLMVAAGLYGRSLYNISQIDTGYNTDSMLLARVVYRSITSTAARQAFLRDLLDQLRAHPEVASVTAGPGTPFGFVQAKVSLPDNPDLTIDTRTTQAASGSFETSGIRLIAGREFDESPSDKDGSVIINKVLADSLWPNQNGIGRAVNHNGVPRSVVGIVEFDRCFGLLASPGPCSWTAFVPQGFQVNLRLRTHGDPARFAPELRRIVRAIHSDVAITDVETLGSHVAALTANHRTSALISSVFAFVGIALVAIGCFSLFESLVKDSAREIAVRIAVGATPRKVISTTLSRGFALVVLGTAIGLGASAVMTGRIADQLFNVASTDMATFIATAIGMIVVGVVASYWPARSAAHKEPITALRQS